MIAGIRRQSWLQNHVNCIPVAFLGLDVAVIDMYQAREENATANAFLLGPARGSPAGTGCASLAVGVKTRAGWADGTAGANNPNDRVKD